MKNFWAGIILIAVLIGLGLYFSSHSIVGAPTVTTVTSLATSTVIISSDADTYDDKTYGLHIESYIPKLSGHAHAEDFNAMVTKLFSSDKESFVQDVTGGASLPDDIYENANTLELLGTVTVYNNRFASLLYTKNYYVYGTAHPANIQESIVYDLDSKKVMTLDDIFIDTQKALEYISSVSIEQVLEELRQQDGESSFVRNGLFPQESNFRIFTISEKGVTFYFAEYQVAPRALGLKQAELTWEELRPLLKPEFKSFI